MGGYVRDALRGVMSSDRDYILADDTRNFVNEIKKVFNGTVIKFKKGKIIRLYLKNGVTFDISELTGSLEEDLLKKGFYY